MKRRPLRVLPGLEDVLSDTYGVIVYQEQVMRIAQILAGYSLGEADLLRRAMGKKKKEEMDQQRVRFLTGAAERGLGAADAEDMFERMAKFAGYGFNKGHAAPYALIAYQTAWLKANTPVEFFAASLSLEISNYRQTGGFLPRREASGRRDSAAGRQSLGRRLRSGGGASSLRLGRRAERGPPGDGAGGPEQATGRPLPGHLRFPRGTDRSASGQQARLRERPRQAGAFDSLHDDRALLVEAADTLIAYAQATPPPTAPPLRRAFLETPPRLHARGFPACSAGTRSASSTKSWPPWAFYPQRGHPLGRPDRGVAPQPRDLPGRRTLAQVASGGRGVSNGGCRAPASGTDIFERRQVRLRHALGPERRI